jgi:chromosome segregation ATPase
MLRWARQTRGRLDPVREVYQAQWGEEQSTSIDGVVVREVLDHSGRLYRFALVTFDTSSSSALSGRKAIDKDYSTFVELHSETVAALERAVWVIDEMLQQVSYRQIASMVKSLASEAEQLAELAQSTSDSQALLARLDRLERLMSRLKEESARLSEGQFKEFLNSQMGEAEGRMDAIRKAIAEGRLEDAQRMLAELSEQLQRFAEGMQEQMSKSGQDDNELGERLEKLMGDLDSLSADQDALAEELAQAREEHGGELSEVMAQWERLDALAAQAVDRSVVVLARVGNGEGFAASTVRNAEVLGQSVRGSRDAVQARDAESALDRVRDAQRYSRFTGRPRGSGKEVLKPELRRLDTPLAEMQSILQRLMDMPRTSSPELQAAAQQLSAQQSQIKARQEQLAQEVQTVERAIPAADGSAQKHMAGAGEAMDDASSALGQGEAMAGEGHQRAAKRKVDQTKQSLQQAQQRQQQMQQQMQRMEGEGEGKAGDGEQPPGPPMASPEIPTPEAFKTPEAYRRALLEGMAEDVPDEFKALKKRFYEELVRQ